MTNLDIMRASGRKFLGDRKAGVFSLIADRFHTVFCSGNIFFHDRFLLKRLRDRGFDRCRKLRRICDLGDRSAAGTVCRLDNHREMFRFHALALSDTCKIRNRDPGFLESAPHGIFVGRLPDTFTAVSRKSQFLCQILYGDIRKI